jgi:hypothetical protein
MFWRIIISVLFFGTISCSNVSLSEINQPVKISIDASKDGPIYGNKEGLIRVEKLEKQLHSMHIIKEHPRIFINPQTIDIYRKRFNKYYYLSKGVIALADRGDIVNLAFLYLMWEKSKPQIAYNCAKDVIKILLEKDPRKGDKRFVGREIAKMALAFDWVYNAMTDKERKIVIDRLSEMAGIDERAKKIRNGWRQSGETFHREEWAFDSYQAWPEIALAHHNPNAEFVYKSRWKYNWKWGDAARMYAYAGDGTPFEGYYYGAAGVDWFLALKSATGINLIDGEFGWCKNAAYHVLYRLDLDRDREIFHHGVGLGAAGCVSYKEGSVAWKIKKFFARTLPLASDNPYIQWVVNHKIGISDWILTTIGYGGLSELGPIARVLFDNPDKKEKDLRQAKYEDLPYARFFPGGNEVYMRTGWFNNPVCVGFRSSPAYTKTSHGDFDVNTFVIYKDGVLSGDSGVYDAYAGQRNYFQYQKNTTAHNDLIVIDPRLPDEPIKLSRAVDPGGVDRVFTRTFGSQSRFGIEDVFLHNSKANWAKIIDFKTTPLYDYCIGDATKAYASRLDEYLRHLVFIRKGNSAYVVIFDRVEAKSPKYIKKSLIHLVTEPKMRGDLIKTKVKDHYEIFNSDFFEAENAFGTSKLFCKVLLPYKRRLYRIGGEGYRFYVEGSQPKNFPITEKTIKRIERQMGGKWQEVGQWRIEIMPVKKQKKDYFMQVMYICDSNENFNPDNVNLSEEGNSFVLTINDKKLGDIKVYFKKSGKPGVKVEIK